MERGRWARQRVARWLRHVEFVLAPSLELAEATRQLNVACPVHYIPNGVDPGRFQPGRSRLRERLGIAASDTVVLLGRRLVAKNGVCIFAAAARDFVRPGVRILFAGDGPERASVESILCRDGCRDAAVFLGNVPNSVMPEVYGASDLSVLPSFLEATSITGLESMASGLPLVGTRVGGIPAIVADGRTGLLVEPGQPGVLAAAIRQLLDDPALRRQMGVAARARVQSEFSWGVIAARTAELYRSIADEAAAGDEPRVAA
jgi:glycosyltransferase involved in cell wall biosynthesis